ncbi:MAG: aldolase [Bacteroidetes bacterium]|nr:aldolase [Bacteroidota bacterium]
MSLKKKLNSGKRIYGCAIVSPSTKWVNVVKQANLDFVFLDTEHMPLGRETLSHMCTMYSGIGIPPIVRIPSPDPYLACTALDGGASAILAPYVETVKQVKELVGAVKYRPLKGEKLQQILDGKETLDGKLKNYIDIRCKNNLLFINVESQPAFDSLPELLSVPGLDGVIIGPHDLSCSMGLPEEYTHPDFEETVTRIIDQCNTKNLGIGIHLSGEPEQQVKWARKGVNIIFHSSDISLFGKILKHEISTIKTELKDDDAESEYRSTTI